MDVFGPGYCYQQWQNPEHPVIDQSQVKQPEEYGRKQPEHRPDGAWMPPVDKNSDGVESHLQRCVEFAGQVEDAVHRDDAETVAEHIKSRVCWFKRAEHPRPIIHHDKWQVDEQEQAEANPNKIPNSAQSLSQRAAAVPQHNEQKRRDKPRLLVKGRY